MLSFKFRTAAVLHVNISLCFGFFIVRVPDAGVYRVGLAVFPTQNPLHNAHSALLLTPKQTSGGIEVRT